MNFSDPILKMRRAMRIASDAGLDGNYDEAIAQLDSIREYALTAQEAMRQEQARRARLEKLPEKTKKLTPEQVEQFLRNSGAH